MRRASPHLTLAHPRNPVAAGNDLAAAAALRDGIVLRFDRAQRIEQVDGGAWRILETHVLATPAMAGATRGDLQIRVDDLRGPEIRSLLAEHLRNMHSISPPESVHALGLDGLRDPRITFWSAWDGDVLLGCGALKQLDPGHGEAVVHIEDRGYQLADAVYEVWALFDGKLADAEGHFARLERSLSELRIPMPMSRAALTIVLREAVRRNRISEGLIYLQVGRGVARRGHAFPDQPVPPAVVITVSAVDRATSEAQFWKSSTPSAALLRASEMRAPARPASSSTSPTTCTRAPARCAASTPAFRSGSPETRKAISSRGASSTSAAVISAATETVARGRTDLRTTT